VNRACQLVSEHAMNGALSLDPRQPGKNPGAHVNAKMTFAAGPPIGMAFVAMAFVDDLQRLGLKVILQFCRDLRCDFSHDNPFAVHFRVSILAALQGGTLDSIFSPCRKDRANRTGGAFSNRKRRRNRPPAPIRAAGKAAFTARQNRGRRSMTITGFASIMFANTTGPGIITLA